MYVSCRDAIASNNPILCLFIIFNLTLSYVSADGSLGSGNIKLSQTSSDADDKKVSVDITEPVSSQFACRYLNLFLKVTCLKCHLSY